MQIERFGNSIAKLFPLNYGDTFSSHFAIARPYFPELCFEALQHLQNQVVIIKSLNQKNTNKLKGQIEYLPNNNTLLFVGTPWFGSIDEVVENNLSFSDFAAHDAVPDMLHVLKEQEIANEEIHKLLAKVNEQSAELKKLSLIVQETANGIVIADNHGRIEWVNKAFEKMSGYVLNEIKGKKPGEVLQGTETNKETIAYLRNQIQNGLPFKCEILNYHRSGNPYWIRISGQPIFDRRGNIIHFFALQEDITAKIEADNKLESQRKFYEDVLNAIPADVAVFSPQHEYLFVNPVAISNPEIRKWIVGKRDEDFCILRNKPLSLAENRRKQFNSILASKKQHEWEEKIIKPNGEEEYLLRKIYPVLDENEKVKLVIGYGINITERKKAEQKTQLSEKRYRDLFNFSQALICTHDMEGNIITVNPSICETLEYSQEELAGINIKQVLPKENLPYFETDYLNKVVENGKHKGVFVVVSKSGKRIYLLYQNFLMQESGEEPYIIGFSQDITDRIRAERELNAAKLAAEEAGKAKQIFLANMSHEIRTPMTGIMGVAELLSKTNQTQQQQEFTKLIIDSTHTLLHIINDVLDIAKIESGKFDLEEVPFKLVDKVNHSIKTFTFKADEKGLLLKFNNHLPADFTVSGDPHRLGQILNNLINNAIKFTNEGSVTLKVQLLQQTKTYATIQFIVADTGIGISKEHQEKIFEAFVQANADTTRRFGGTGLGLSICKQLIEQQGGQITLESEENKGAIFTFQITYKLADASLVTDNLNLAQASASIPPLKVLVAEDVQLNQIIAKNILEGWGHTVHLANNGKEALEKVFDNQYDLILMDVHMPEMDGLTATRHIRGLSNPKKAQVPIIALTASAFKTDTNRYIEAGMNAYITKPYTQQKLFISIAAQLGFSIQNPIAISQEQPTSMKQLFDYENIKALDDDEEFIRQMVEVFIEQVHDELKELNKLVLLQDWPLVYKVAHKLKPTLGTFNIQSAQNLILDIEKNARYNTNVQEIPALCNQLSAILQQVIEQMQQNM